MLKVNSIPDIDNEMAKNIVSLANKFVVKLSQVLTNESPHDREVIDYIYFVNILSRTLHNSQFLMSHKLLPCIIQICKLCTLKLLAISNDEQYFYIWWDYIKLLMSYSLQIIGNFTNPRHLWLSQQQQPLVDTDLTFYSDSKMFLFNLGLLKIIQGIFIFLIIILKINYYYNRFIQIL